MKTYLITSAAEILIDTPSARLEEFIFLSEWTGDEWSSDRREQFATRYVSKDCSDPEDLDDPTILEKPWTVSYNDRYHTPTESFEVARFATEAESLAFAEAENARLLREFLADEKNFTLLDLPDDIEPDIETIRQGKYPLSKKITCQLSRDTIEVEANAHWTASGVTDSWPRTETIKQTLVDLLSNLIDTAIEEALASIAAQPKPFTPGDSVIHVTTDLQRYPGTVKSVDGTDILITFPNGTESIHPAGTCFHG